MQSCTKSVNSSEFTDTRCIQALNLSVVHQVCFNGQTTCTSYAYAYLVQDFHVSYCSLPGKCSVNRGKWCYVIMYFLLEILCIICIQLQCIHTCSTRYQVPSYLLVVSRTVVNCEVQNILFLWLLEGAYNPDEICTWYCTELYCTWVLGSFKRTKLGP